jgi:hypothetical protein
MRRDFFAEPIYLGNRGLVPSRMIGNPGARYDYRDWIVRQNKRFPLPTVSQHDRAVRLHAAKRLGA